MTTHIRCVAPHQTLNATLGALQHITPHRGMDHVTYMDLRFQWGLMQMTADELRTLVRLGQEVLAARQTVRNLQAGDYSGAAADLEEGEA